MEHRNYSGTLNPSPYQRELEHKRLSRELAVEGMVLLKNEGLLPLDVSVPIALLGSGAVYTIKGGTGSGDVNCRETVSICDGLKEAGCSIVTGPWLEDYRSRYQQARQDWKKKVLEDAKHVENPFDAYACNPFIRPEGRPITLDDLKGASVAIYVLSRISGEGKDRRKEEGDYYLSRREQEDLLELDRQAIPTVLLLNTGGPMELAGILEQFRQIQAVLNLSQPGQEAGHAVADILLGKACPSGKLTATWARRYEDYPSANSFSYLSGNLNISEYTEGIFVGYRHFDRSRIQPLFPFGFGLSYTTFAMDFNGLQKDASKFQIHIIVKNTGKQYAGREVVQLYTALPQSGMEKEHRRLIGFAKTKLLHPGESQCITIPVEQRRFASFSEKENAWIIESGEYGLLFGASSASLQPGTTLTLPQIVIPVNADSHKERKSVSLGDEIPTEDLLPLLYGNITSGASTLGSSGIRVPGSAGETTEALEEQYNIPSFIMADGPAGLRLRQTYQVDRLTGDVYPAGVLGSLENGFLEPFENHKDADTYYQYCTAFPVGTALAQTWDTEILQRFGEAVAVEMEEFHIDLWLAPGMNIQRNPLCGRNFEYYSEDPLLTGFLAAAVTAGVQSRKGRGVTLKHFACNNQEDNRMGVDVHVSQRALREIYLLGFELAVKLSQPAAVMSAYNLVNGVHAANSQELCTTILREDWGFTGVVMSDWNTTVPEDGSIPWLCADAGNDIIMPGNPKDDENIRTALAQGKLTEKAIRTCAGRILAMINRVRLDS